MSISLEDNFRDILGKAQRGSGMGEAELLESSGLSLFQWQSLLNSPFSSEQHDILARVASALNLQYEALLQIALEDYQPEASIGVLPANLYRDVSPYGHAGVNSYLLADPENGQAVAIDCGSNADGLLAILEESGLALQQIFLTHSIHLDHTGGLSALLERYPDADVLLHENESLEGAIAFSEGEQFHFGGVTISTVLTAGHSVGGSSFVVEGFSVPLAFVGDALFAGSIGGITAGNDAYLEGLNQLGGLLSSLSPECLLCPGHGQLSKVSLELEGNPFLAGRV